MKLTHIFDAQVKIAMPPTAMKGAAGAERIIFDVQSGVVSEVGGSGIKGTVDPVGGDWAFHPGDGYWRLDIRSIVSLDIGTKLYLRARGLVEINAAVQEALANGTEIQFGDTYFTTAAQFDIAPSDPTVPNTPQVPDDIALLRHRLGLTRGRFGAGFVEYQMFRVDDPTQGSAC